MKLKYSTTCSGRKIFVRSSSRLPVTGRCSGASNATLPSCAVREMGRIRLTHYQLLIRELEAQLQHDAFWLKTEKPKVANSLSHDRQFEFSTKIQNLFELAKLAFRTDSTRVVTLSMDWIYGAIKVPGATGGWHTLSHHGYNADALEEFELY